MCDNLCSALLACWLYLCACVNVPNVFVLKVRLRYVSPVKFTILQHVLVSSPRSAPASAGLTARTCSVPRASWSFIFHHGDGRASQHIVFRPFNNLVMGLGGDKDVVHVKSLLFPALPLSFSLSCSISFPVTQCRNSDRQSCFLSLYISLSFVHWLSSFQFHLPQKYVDYILTIFKCHSHSFFSLL